MIIPPAHPYEYLVLSDRATFILLDFRVLGTFLAEDPLPKVGLPVVLRTEDPAAWHRLCDKVVRVFGGFGSHAHFTRTFVHRFGVSPTQWRRRWHEGVHGPKVLKRHGP